MIRFIDALAKVRHKFLFALHCISSLWLGTAGAILLLQYLECYPITMDIIAQLLISFSLLFITSVALEVKDKLLLDRLIAQLKNIPQGKMKFHQLPVNEDSSPL